MNEIIFLSPLIFLLVYGLILVFEWSRVYQPTRTLVDTPDSSGLEYEDVRFVAEDGTVLHGWWIPHEGASACLIYMHGSAGNLGDRIATLRTLHRLGLHLFAFDYRGYGRSRGIPCERGTARDARAAYEVVRSQYGDIESPPVLLLGRSLGGAVAIRLAAERPVHGLIVEATFPSITRMARHRYPRLLTIGPGRIHYPSIDCVPHLTMPKLFAHSRDDDVIPLRFARALYDAAHEPKQFAELRGGHAEPGWLHTSAYWDTLAAFIARVTTPESILQAARQTSAE